MRARPKGSSRRTCGGTSWAKTSTWAACCRWGPCWYAQKQFFEGKIHPLSTSEYLMRYDVEVSGFPSSHAGHLCLLRLKEDDYPGTTRIEEWPSWDLPVLKWGKAQGGVVGFSHSGWGLKTRTTTSCRRTRSRRSTASAPMNTSSTWCTTRSTSSRPSTRPRPWELNIWYHTLNCGYRTKISGETDFPCIYGERVGLGRVYVKLPDGQLDFDRWCEGIKQGRSYVGDGRSHLIDFQVNDRGVGESGGELKLDAPATVKVTAQVAAYLDPDAHARGSERSTTVRSIRSPTGTSSEPESTTCARCRSRSWSTANRWPRPRSRPTATIQGVSFDVPIEKSSWVALRVYPSSHTNPVFVSVGGKPIRASRKSAEWCLKSGRPVLVEKGAGDPRQRKGRGAKRPTKSPARRTGRSWRSAMGSEAGRGNVRSKNRWIYPAHHPAKPTEPPFRWFCQFCQCPSRRGEFSR